MFIFKESGWIFSDSYFEVISEPFCEIVYKVMKSNCFTKYQSRILIYDKFSFQRCINWMCYFNRYQMNAGGGGGGGGAVCAPLLFRFVFCESVYFSDYNFQKTKIFMWYLFLTWLIKIAPIYMKLTDVDSEVVNK